MENEIVDHLAQVSRDYGKGFEYVLAGGGNTSVKEGNTMYVKASGSRMGTIEAKDFVAMDLEKLRAVWQATYSRVMEEREAQALADLMAARKPGEETKRPSVETLLHSLFPETWVIHTHPGKVNGLTCGVQGPELVKEIFGTEALWIPIIEPGYILAKAVKDAMDTAGGPIPLVFLQNHGIFVSGNTIEEVQGRYALVEQALSVRIRPLADSTPTDWSEFSPVEEVKKAWVALGETEPFVLPFTSPILESFLVDPQTFKDLEKSLTPDHIVYAGFRPLFVPSVADLITQVKAYKDTHNEVPKIVAIQGGGCLAVTLNEKKAIDARDLFLDAARVTEYSRGFGGPVSMPNHLIDFIRNWEVEKYRASQ